MTTRTTPGLTSGRWTKARRSDNASGCVEVLLDHDRIRVRDSKQHGAGPELSIALADWPTLCDRLLNTPISNLPIRTGVSGINAHVGRARNLTLRGLDGMRQAASLRFSTFETECFLNGLRHGEFDVLDPSGVGGISSE